MRVNFLWIITFLVVLAVGQFTAILILLLRLTESRERKRYLQERIDRIGGELGAMLRDTSGALAVISTPLSKPEGQEEV